MVDYSRIIGEAPMKKMKPSVMVFRLDLKVLELAAAGIVFRRLPSGFGNIWEFIGIRGSREGPRGGHNPSGRAGAPLARPGGLCSPQPTFLALLWPTRYLLVQKKSPKSFIAIGLRLVLIFCEVKNKKKNSNWHLALCQ